MNRKILVVLFFALVALVGCGKRVTRIGADTTVDLSGRWNDADSRLVAEEMLNDALSRPWYNNLYASKNHIPVIVVGDVRNRTHEHISVETFVRNIERSILNSGKAQFVAGKAERAQLRQELESQGMHAAEDTRSQAIQETGADLMLMGTITSIEDREGREAVVFYQVNMELINIQNHQKVWIGEKQIKKYIKRDALKL
jgi:penicillin-binding protein activator